MVRCASCFSVLPDGARFCPSCGTEVVTTAAEERRVVTVVFADLVGYTKLSEYLDPERVKRLIDACFQRLIADIQAFGGRIDKVLGDGILALFGAPIAHEDDADRAIRAAIQMQESLARFVAEQPELEQPLGLRIGVNTGEVVVGTVSGTSEYTALGDVVNVAARLQELAPPGGILIGDATAELATSEIVREPVDDLEVRGREQVVRVWRVTGRQRRVLGPLVRHDDVPFVGRTTQWELMASVMAMVADGRSAVVAVSGEAGSGKSRLVTEALESFPSADVTIFAGVCTPFGETNVWAPIANALFRRLEVDTSAPVEEVADLLRSKAVELYGFDSGDPAVESFVHGVLHLLGYPSELDSVAPAQARETLFAFIVEGLRRRTQTGPVVLWIDDLQWADVLIIDLLNRLARSLVDRPLLIVTAQRDEVELDWPPAVDQPLTVRLPLDPLTRDDATRVIASLNGATPSDALVDQLYERSGGNPLFLIELATLSVDSPDNPELPGSLRALISARLDRLPARCRDIVDNAAVLGSNGPIDALERFAAELGQEYDAIDLDELVDAGVLEVTSDGWWHFRSDVVREVAYQTLTKYARAQRHAGVAAVMSDDHRNPIDRIAHHAASAAELVGEIGAVPGVPSIIGDQAVALLVRAARRAMDVGAFNQTVRQTTRALDLGPSDGAVARELLLIRAQAEAERRQTDAARGDAEDALDAAIAADDRRQVGIARRLLGILYQRDGDLHAAREELGASVELFRGLGDDVELASSLRERGLAEVFGGSLHDAEWLLGEAEALTEQLDDARGRAWVRQHQAWVAFLSGDTAAAEARLITAAQEFDLLGDRFGRGWAVGLLAWVRFYQRRPEEAEKLAIEVRTMSGELGDPWAPAMMDTLIASIRLWSGDFAEADELSRRALAGFRRLGDRFGTVLALAPRMRSLVALGRSHEAERAMEELLALSDGFGDLSSPAMGAAGAAVHLGLGERAVTISEMAVSRSDAMGAEGTEVRATFALALCQADRADDALAVLETADGSAPYPTAVRALASAMIGDTEAALRSARAVLDESGASYLDQVIAGVAAASVEAGSGDVLAADEWLSRAAATARSAGDVVAKALVAAAAAGFASEHRGGLDHLGPGWRTVVDRLVGMAVAAGAEAAPGEASPGERVPS